MHSMRWTRRFCWFAVLAAAFAGLAAAQPAAAQEVKLNEVLRSLFYAPQYVAARSGAFEQEGLKIAGPKTTWGVQAAVTEVVSGNSNIALMGPEAAGLTQDASPDRRLVNFALLTNGGGAGDMSQALMTELLGELAGIDVPTRPEPVESGFGFDDLVLAPAALRQLADFVSWRSHAPRILDDWGLGPAFSRRRGVVALFRGPPGTGSVIAAGLREAAPPGPFSQRGARCGSRPAPRHLRRGRD